MLWNSPGWNAVEFSRLECCGPMDCTGGGILQAGMLWNSPGWNAVEFSRLECCGPMDCTGGGILQARMLEWVSLSLLQGIFPSQDRTRVSCKCEEAPGVADGQGGLVCCSPWGRQTEQRNRKSGIWAPIPHAATRWRCHPQKSGDVPKFLHSFGTHTSSLKYLKCFPLLAKWSLPHLSAFNVAGISLFLF